MIQTSLPILRTISLLLLTCLLPSLLNGAEPSRRPNVVIVFADDWGRHAGAYASLDGPGTVNDVVRTPNFDRIAKEGVLFRSAFVSAPSCTPSRSALLSGQHFWRTGRGSVLRGEWDGSNPSFPLLLRDAGYHIGKFHKVWTPGNPPDAPFGGRQYAYENAGHRFNDFSENVTKLVATGELQYALPSIEPLVVLRAQGVKIVGLSSGEPDFPTPAHAIEAAHAAALALGPVAALFQECPSHLFE